MQLKSFIKPTSYLKLIKWLARVLKAQVVMKKKISIVPLTNIWTIPVLELTHKTNTSMNFQVFNQTISLKNKIYWHKDYNSNFEYPLKPFYNIKVSKGYNKGIDVKFPWEVSRFYFAVNLAQNYLLEKEKRHYELFKRHVSDWLDDNPFCTGVNWVCTMDVAIRSTNWIVAICLFWKAIEKEEAFLQKLTGALVQHAIYIDSYTENIGNNHDISNYAGLLFLSLMLKKHPRSKQWLDKAVSGLETNIRKQVFNDGVNFEYSTSYHRLVLEFFAYSFIVGNLHGVEFSPLYKKKLFKMFEFSATYINHCGLSPQVGDNDSGRFLIFHKSQCLDHTYLLNLGEHIFDNTFTSQCAQRTQNYDCWLPKIRKENVPVEKPKDGTKSTSFTESGFYFLKNRDINIMINANNINKKSRIGHKHFDIGSFTLSYKGQQIFIDPGTYTYTSSLRKRNYFRHIKKHNCTFFDSLETNKYTCAKTYFGSDLLFPPVNVLDYKNNSILFCINYGSLGLIEREIFIFDKRINIIDKGKGYLVSCFQLRGVHSCKSKSLFANNYTIHFESDSLSSTNSLESLYYNGIIENASVIQVKGFDLIKAEISFFDAK